MKSIVLLLSSIMLLTACAQQQIRHEPVSVAEPDKGWVILFQEKRPFEDDGPVRMSVTQKFLRLDDGKDSSDFVLFDRTAKIIYNVVHDDKSTLVIRERKIVMPDRPAYEWTVEKTKSNALMRSGDKNETNAMYYEYSINNTRCYSVVSVEAMLPEVLQAMREYRQVLGGELARSYMQSDEPSVLCDAAVNIIEPQKVYETGFPIREWNDFGYQRFVMDYRWDVVFKKNLFVLPSGYTQYALGE